ncbi:hypothetical protein [Bifidobacterium thermophilum]|uniref:Uncharacterized protein n=1 Tax=Bifidobacterium thermophilum TaxID=33905 RepID=A0A7X9NSS5_9BIFI|nr:hypothetical protein [Bifidobacterium thermophilum]NME62968.1 hypothetical protein [Bifidobacterium thermophilum]
MICRPGQLEDYWPQSADDLAWAEGYPPVSECGQAIARGEVQCQSGLNGFADYGIVEWRDDRIVSLTLPGLMLMYGKEASNRKQEIDRQHYTIPNQRPKDKHCGKI